MFLSLLFLLLQDSDPWVNKEVSPTIGGIWTGYFFFAGVILFILFVAIIIKFAFGSGGGIKTPKKEEKPLKITLITKTEKFPIPPPTLAPVKIEKEIEKEVKVLCSSCGLRIQSTDEFCPHCGEQL